MNTSQQKLLAASLMVIDHIGAVFFPSFLALRVVGRLSMPLFLWLLVRGSERTRNMDAYIKRVAVLALVSQVPYLLLFGPGPFNILALFTGVLLCLRSGRWWSWLVLALVAQVGPIEYGVYGVALALALALRNWGGWLALHSFLVVFNPLQSVAVLAGGVIALDSGPGGPRLRWFYWFYPAHLALLCLLDARF
jgi:hypothetical protein